LPPLQALLALHTFWVVVIGPPAIIAGRRLTPAYAERVGMAAVLIAVSGLAGIAVYEYLTWASGNIELRKYIFRRILFVVADSSMIPLLPLLAGGVLCFALGYSRRKQTRSSRDEMETGNQETEQLPF
jgi:hypothetical protein